MKKINKIHINDIEKNIGGCLVKIEHTFIKKLLKKASKSNNPYNNRKFIEDIGLTFNDSTKRCIGIASLIKHNRAIEFSTLQKLKILSNSSWLDIEKNLISIRLGRHKGEIFPKFPIRLDKKMGSVVGHILGDGSIDKRYLQISYNNKDRDLIIEFRDCMRKIFGIEPRIWVQESGKFKVKTKWISRLENVKDIQQDTQVSLFYPSICGLFLNSIFGDFAIGADKKITDNINRTQKEFKIGLVRAFFDDECHIDKERGPRVYQDDELMLIRLKNILDELGIHSFPVRCYFRRNKPQYFFNINQKKNYLRYYELIGFTSKKKERTLEALVKKPRQYRLKNFP